MMRFPSSPTRSKGYSESERAREKDKRFRTKNGNEQLGVLTRLKKKNKFSKMKSLMLTWEDLD